MHHGGVCGAELRGIYKGLVPVVSVGRGLAPGDGDGGVLRWWWPERKKMKMWCPKGFFIIFYSSETYL